MRVCFRNCCVTPCRNGLKPNGLWLFLMMLGSGQGLAQRSIMPKIGIARLRADCQWHGWRVVARQPLLTAMDGRLQRAPDSPVIRRDGGPQWFAQSSLQHSIILFTKALDKDCIGLQYSCYLYFLLFSGAAGHNQILKVFEPYVRQ